MAERIIQISITRPVEQGSFEQAKAFNFSFEGSYADIEEVQLAVSATIEKLLWEKKGNQGINAEEKKKTS